MENKRKYILIFSILIMLLAVVSVATATEVNAAKSVEYKADVIYTSAPPSYIIEDYILINGKYYSEDVEKIVSEVKLTKTTKKLIKKGKTYYIRTTKHIQYKKISYTANFHTIYDDGVNPYNVLYFDNLPILKGYKPIFEDSSKKWFYYNTNEFVFSKTQKINTDKKVKKGQIISKTTPKYWKTVKIKGIKYNVYRYKAKVAVSSSKIKTVTKTYKERTNKIVNVKVTVLA